MIMTVAAIAPFVVSILNIILIVSSVVRYRKMRKKDERHVDGIVRYQRGDLDPWDSRFLEQSKARKRTGYTFDSRYHEDPWEVGVPRD